MENTALRERLSKYKQPPKESFNSSIPPSKENLKRANVNNSKNMYPICKINTKAKPAATLEDTYTITI